jgi:predicted phage terminase large subunit-like protein
MVFMPPRHLKSETVTVRYAAWRILRNPAMSVIIGAYNQTLAERFSRRAQKTLVGRVELDKRRQAAAEWETAAGGGLRAAGVGGGVTGMGAELIVIDDPVKSREDANSETMRNKTWDWYCDDLYTRRNPDCAMVLIMTRWHEDDLAGRLLARMGSDDEFGDDWEVVNFPALAEDNDLLGRRFGEALCPERYDLDELERIRAVLGNSFYALYQQRPQPLEGGMFKKHWFEPFVSSAPPRLECVRYWDKAATEDGGCHTAGVLIGKTVDGQFFIVDVVRGQWSVFERESIIKRTAVVDRARYGNVVVIVEQEPGSGGKESAEATIRNLAGYSVYADRPTGDKETRAEPLAAQAEGGNVKLVRGDWNAVYLDELAGFPFGKYADQVDASSGAFNYLADTYNDAGEVVNAQPHRFSSSPY